MVEFLHMIYKPAPYQIPIVSSSLASCLLPSNKSHETTRERD